VFRINNEKGVEHTMMQITNSQVQPQSAARELKMLQGRAPPPRKNSLKFI
jgi:hypothetical protein